LPGNADSRGEVTTSDRRKEPPFISVNVGRGGFNDMCEVCTATTKEIERLKAWRKRQRTLCGEVPRKAYYDEYYAKNREAKLEAARIRYKQRNELLRHARKTAEDKNERALSV